VTEARGSGGTRIARGLAGWGLLALLVGYTAFVHHGVGPTKLGYEDRWFTPTSSFFESDLLYPLVASFGVAFAAFGAVALLLVVAVFLTTRSAFARAIALSCLAATALFVFYGVFAPFPWEFFGWRGSAVLVLTASTAGFSAAAPWLAASWLRLSWPWRVLAYLPFVLFVVFFMRNATGTDRSLPFAISPWPAVPVFGLEVGSLFCAVAFLGAGIAVAGIEAARSGERGPAPAIAGVAAGIAAPLLVLLAGSALGTLPFRVGAGTLTSVIFVVLVAIAVGALLRSPPRPILVGAALVGLPLFASQAWAYLDYAITREVRARAITDALAAWFEREGIYPDGMEELVAAGDLEAVPEPAIGFGFLYDGVFRYQNFGQSFILEFPAPRWVECAYTPPYEVDEEDAEEYEDDREYGEILGADVDEDLDEAWSCPSKPPELW
jgi:hypothetical protein